MNTCSQYTNHERDCGPMIGVGRRRSCQAPDPGARAGDDGPIEILLAFLAIFRVNIVAKGSKLDKREASYQVAQVRKNRTSNFVAAVVGSSGIIRSWEYRTWTRGRTPSERCTFELLQAFALSRLHTHPTATSSSKFQQIFNKVLKAYGSRTKQDLLRTHSLPAGRVAGLKWQLQACDSPYSIFRVLQQQVQQLNRSQTSDSSDKMAGPDGNYLCRLCNPRRRR